MVTVMHEDAAASKLMLHFIFLTVIVSVIADSHATNGRNIVIIIGQESLLH